MPKLLAGFVAPPGKHECFPEASCVRLGFYEIDRMERSVRLGLYEIDRMERTQRLWNAQAMLSEAAPSVTATVWMMNLGIKMYERFSNGKASAITFSCRGGCWEEAFKTVGTYR